MRGSGDHCPDDLLARSRKGPLSAVERRALDAHLGVCGFCRATVALGALHDEVPDLSSADDAAVVARLAGRVVGPAGRRTGRARALAIAAGIALMTLAGAAAAWRAVRRAPAPVSAVAVVPPRERRVVARVARPTPVAPIVASAPPVSTSHRRHAPAIHGSPAAPAEPDGPDRLFARANAARSAGDLGAAEPALPDRPDRLFARANAARGADDLRAAAPAEPDGPDRLFARANAARGAGDLRAAEADYARLESRYPTSPEAAVALVSAGDLLVRLGQPAAALDRFDRYLSASARGPLAPEALFGRARCLRELGQRHDEADAWRALLQSFPGSLYERTGSRRLVELGADGSPP